jgi:hypothetical protein
LAVVLRRIRIMFSFMNDTIAPPRVGAPRTFATSIRLREVLAVHVGVPRARAIIEHLTSVELLPAGSRRFSVPVSPGNAAFALVAAVADAGIASDAACRALRIGAARRYVPGEPTGPTVFEAITAEIEAVLADPTFEPFEWHFALAITKAVDHDGEFELYLPVPPADPTALTLGFKFERVDVLPSGAIVDVAGLWR